MISARRKTIAILIGLMFVGAHAQDAGQAPAPTPASSAGLRGKMQDDSKTFVHDMPPSSERQMTVLMLSTGLSASDIQTMRVTTVPVEAPMVTMTFQDEVTGANFNSGRAELLPLSQKKLEEVIAKVKGKRNIRFEVIGHTDIQRISAELRRIFPTNQELSEARALAVAGYLKDKLGLAANAFTVKGKGESQPVASNRTPAGMARNRRTEVRVWYDEQSKQPPGEKHVVQASSSCGGGGAPSTVDLPFRITIDGEPMDDKLWPEADRQRCVDVGLERADIQVKYDPMNVSPALNAWVTPNGALRGEAMEFSSYANYVVWIRKAEVRVFTKGQRPQQTPFAVVPLEIGGSAKWTPPKDAPTDLQFLLRVYDEKGRFDETALKQLTLLERRVAASDLDKPERERLTGYGETSLQLRNIPVSGGTVTISGKNILPGETVTALGAPVPVDPKGKFATRQIVPAGPAAVEVAVKNPKGEGRTFRRNLTIADKDWFYVAVADLTAGRQSTTGPAKLVTADSSDHYDKKTYIDGRGAFYLKGKIKGEYLLTASADTREGPFKDLFSNFTSKDPQYLLRRLDPDRYYPVYGDDSTIVDDAPTQGKFFVKIEKGDSHAMWGNFQTTWTGTELTQYSRGLYGANVVWHTDATTQYGEKKASVNVFAAQPGTIQSREEFRGTGGSLYYMRRQDITQGSERVWVEIRDPVSGMVLERRALTPAQDYDVNYLQGRLTLRAPLGSTADGSTLVQNGSLSGNPVYLVVTYEYAPTLVSMKGTAVGGRASTWITENVRVGATTYRQGDDGADQKLQGVDATFRYKPGTFVNLEAARSSGAGVGTLSSIDGGFAFNQQTVTGARAGAKRVEAQVDLSEVSDKAKGKIAGYYQDREQGYSGPGQVAPGEAVTQRGLSAAVPITDRTDVLVKGDARVATSQSVKAVEAAVRQKLTEEVSVSLGARKDDRDTQIANASALLSQTGNRTDVIARLDYKPLLSTLDVAAQNNPEPPPDGSDPNRKPLANAQALARQPWEVYGFVQGTVEKSGNRQDNDRVGVGGAYQVNDRVKLGAEVSAGDGGPGGKLSGDYRMDDRSNAYLAYSVETERPDMAYRGRFGNLVAGSRYRLSENVGLFGESRWANGAGPNSLMHAFGVDLAPTDRLTTGIKVESGWLSDPLAGDLKRRAIGVSAAYKYERMRLASGLEFRDESGTIANRRVWLMRNSLSYQANVAWRMIGKLNFSRSSSSLGAFYDGDFTEAVLGAAYRPADNDRWNTLFKYTYFYNLPSPGQVAAYSNQVADYAQKSHVVSVDTIYDVRPWVSVGLKYGRRWGQLKPTKLAGDWFDSTADLWVLRGDFHVVRQWDAVVEARRLRAKEADDARTGLLLAAYRHVGENAKLGLGYNFTDFSDNLTDLSYRNRGWFINVLSAW